MNPAAPVTSQAHGLALRACATASYVVCPPALLISDRSFPLLYLRPFPSGWRHLDPTSVPKRDDKAPPTIVRSGLPSTARRREFQPPGVPHFPFAWILA